jgi:hypothetical protein
VARLSQRWVARRFALMVGVCQVTARGVATLHFASSW